MLFASLPPASRSSPYLCLLPSLIFLVEKMLTFNLFFVNSLLPIWQLNVMDKNLQCISLLQLLQQV